MKRLAFVLLLAACHTPPKPVPQRELPLTAAEQAEYDRVEKSGDERFQQVCMGDSGVPGDADTAQWCSRRFAHRKDVPNQKRWLLRALADEDDKNDICNSVADLYDLSNHADEDIHGAKNEGAAIGCLYAEGQKKPCVRQCEKGARDCTDHASMPALSAKKEDRLKVCSSTFQNCVVSCPAD